MRVKIRTYGAGEYEGILRDGDDLLAELIRLQVFYVYAVDGNGTAGTVDEAEQSKYKRALATGTTTKSVMARLTSLPGLTTQSLTFLFARKYRSSRHLVSSFGLDPEHGRCPHT